MNNREVATVVALIKQICPAQKTDEYTAEAWFPLLEDVRMVDAREALVNLGRTQTFIGPADIIREVKAIRSARVAAGPKFDPRAYPEATDDAGELEAMRDHTRRLADGEPPRPVPPQQERQRDVAALLAPMVERMVIDVPCVRVPINTEDGPRPGCATHGTSWPCSHAPGNLL